ncbi:MAG TPA: GPW/gp25 family protein [Fimbriimonadaceae bacterium]|nr:GPW/gp25 family protein [Fimbriimonadaceae bacterium]
MEGRQDFLGSGWKFPPQLDVRGRIALAHQEEDIDEAIRVILMTRKGERPFRPEFGSDLHQVAFAPNNVGTAGLASRYVREALVRWEPRIEVLDVSSEPDINQPARLMISIRYRPIDRNSERNLVFPFYTIPGEED